MGSIHCGAREGGMVRFDRCRIDDKEKLEIEHCANDADFECFIVISDFPSLKNDHFIEDIFAHDLNGNTELIVDMGKQVTGRSAGCRRRAEFWMKNTRTWRLGRSRIVGTATRQLTKL